MPDRPAHILEIPDSLGRDVDAYREGRLKNPPPAEAFLSEAALAGAERATAAATAPVHAEDLIPISRAEAARRTTFDGKTLPAMPVTRRVIPEPFRRQRIDISRHGRTWQPCPPELVEPGDMVTDVGLVVAVRTETVREDVAGVPDVATGMRVILTGAGGIERAYGPGERVRAFRKTG